MTDSLQDYDASALVNHVQTKYGPASSIQFVHVPGTGLAYLYLWDNSADGPLSSVAGFDDRGLELLLEQIEDLRATGEIAPEHDAAALELHTDVGSNQIGADSVTFECADDRSPETADLLLAMTETASGHTLPAVWFDRQGVEMFCEWVTNARIERREVADDD